MIETNVQHVQELIHGELCNNSYVNAGASSSPILLPLSLYPSLLSRSFSIIFLVLACCIVFLPQKSILKQARESGIIQVKNYTKSHP